MKNTNSTFIVFLVWLYSVQLLINSNNMITLGFSLIQAECTNIILESLNSMFDILYQTMHW